MREYLNIVVTGEVDSGKSTLIGRLLYETGTLSRDLVKEIEGQEGAAGNFEFAYLLDSFEEERKNQLTIDTTQAFCKGRNDRNFIFIDVPGHQELLKNMLCGTSYADMAILVVDVRKSIEEQTKRHAFILKFLGINNIILVLNKMDLAGFNQAIFKSVRQDLIKYFQGLGLQVEYFIPVSAKQGDNLFKASKNMAWYDGLTVIEVLNDFDLGKSYGKFRFSVQDVYGTHKGKIAVGRILSGEIRTGDQVNILPLQKAGTVKTIEDFQKNISFSQAPKSIGLMLDDMSDIKRGQIICKPGLTRVSREILAKIFCIYPLDLRQGLVFNCLAQETSASIKEIQEVWDTASLAHRSSRDRLEKFDVARLVISLEDPVAIESFTRANSLGRFVLSNNNEICGAGIIL